MKISIQGVGGSYHDTVAREAFGDAISLLERDYFTQVFEDVAESRADHGVIAIENSLVGSLLDNYDLLLEHDLSITGERYLRISHQLMALPGTEIEEITEVRSHPMALKQCSHFLEQHPQWRIVEDADTAGSAADIREGHLTTVAAVASKLAAEIYELDIIASSIENNPNNYTRFLIISKQPETDSETDKTSVVFTANHTPGSLAKVLSVFAENNLNLTKIESRPIVGDTWKYYFYIDFEGGSKNPNTKKAIAEMSEFTSWYKILGNYKQGKTD